MQIAKFGRVQKNCNLAVCMWKMKTKSSCHLFRSNICRIAGKDRCGVSQGKSVALTNRRFTWRADLYSYVSHLVAMVIWSLTSNMANRGQNVPVGSTPTGTIGPQSRSRLSAGYVLAVRILKWWTSRSIFKACRVFSFDIVQSDSFLCWPIDEQNREAFACELTHSRLAMIIRDVWKSARRVNRL